MCNSIDVRDPEKRLADLMQADLGVKIDSIALRLFLLHRWSAVTAYAHAIHGASVAEGRKPVSDVWAAS